MASLGRRLGEHHARGDAPPSLGGGQYGDGFRHRDAESNYAKKAATALVKVNQLRPPPLAVGRFHVPKHGTAVKGIHARIMEIE